MFLFQIRPLYQMIVLGNLVVWPFFTFSFLHDAMHLRDFWMARVPLINCWFRRARRLHDIHHHSVNGTGHMDTNFSIGFFLFDWIFGTLATRHRPLNRKGLAIALQRYRLTMSSGSLRGESTADGEAGGPRRSTWAKQPPGSASVPRGASGAAPDTAPTRHHRPPPK